MHDYIDKNPSGASLRQPAEIGSGITNMKTIPSHATKIMGDDDTILAGTCTGMDVNDNYVRINDIPYVGSKRVSVRRYILKK